MKHYYRIAMMRTSQDMAYLQIVDNMWRDEEFIESMNDFKYWLSDRVYYENKKETEGQDE